MKLLRINPSSPRGKVGQNLVSKERHIYPVVIFSSGLLKIIDVMPSQPVRSVVPSRKNMRIYYPVMYSKEMYKQVLGFLCFKVHDQQKFCILA